MTHRPSARPRTRTDPGAVTVHTRLWCTIAMMACALFANLLQPAIRMAQYPLNSAGSDWCTVAVLIGFVAIIVIPYRSARPRQMLYTACILVVVFPLDSLMPIMLLTSTLARRSGKWTTIRSVFFTTLAALFSQIRDASQPADASVWRILFSKPHADGAPIVVAVNEWVIYLTAILVTLTAVALATVIGLHIQSLAGLHEAILTADSAQHQAVTLQQDLSNKQLTEAIAAEAHDTLANSLTHISLKTNVLAMQANRLETPGKARGGGGAAGAESLTATVSSDSANAAAATATDELRAMQDRAKDIQSDAKQALDEVHNIIGMLKDPQMAMKALAPSDETSLTRESLEDLLGSARNGGTAIATWIDIQQLSELNPEVGKVAYRTVQEGLTNAARHAPGQQVALEINANPQQGVHVRLSNRIPPAKPGNDSSGLASHPSRGATAPMSQHSMQHHTAAAGGNGLNGLEQRARRVGGTCSHEMDGRRHQFVLEMNLPWIWAQPADATTNRTASTAAHRRGNHSF